MGSYNTFLQDMEFAEYDIDEKLEKIKGDEKKLEFLENLDSDVDLLLEGMAFDVWEKLPFDHKFNHIQNMPHYERYYTKEVVELHKAVEAKNYVQIDNVGEEDFTSYYDFLKEIYNELNLLQKSFIRRRCDEYEKKLEPEINLTDDKIIWNRDRKDFAAIFDALMNYGYITYRKNKLQMFAKHFTWIDGEMKPKQLKTLFSNIRNKPELYQPSDEVQEIISKLKPKGS